MEQTTKYGFNKPNGTDFITDDRLWKTNWDKVDAEINNLESSLASKAQQTDVDNIQSTKADKTYVDNITKSLASGSPKGVYPTLADLQAAKPTGDANIYVVTADGKWYYYNNGWVAGGTYQGAVLGDLSVKSEQIGKGNILPLDLYNSTTINLLDISKIASGFVGNDGVITASSVYSYSDYIPVVAGETYAITATLSSQGGFYDANKVWVAKINQSVSSALGGYLITVPSTPSGIAFMRVNVNNPSTYMIVKGNKYPSSYLGYGEKKGVPWLKTEIDFLPSQIVTLESFFNSETANLFDKAQITLNKYINNAGALLDSAIISASDYIQVIPSSTYTVAKGYSTQGGMYDKNKNYIGAIPHPASSTGTAWTFTIPANCHYLRVNVTNNDLNSFMLVSGENFPSSYSGYGVTIPWLRLPSTAIVSKWANKKWGVIGDSITERNFRTSKNYHGYISDKIGCNVTNYGISGTGWRTPSSSGAQPIYNRISTMSADLDLITVFAGTNDWGQTGVPLVLGNMGDTTTETFFGTVDNVIKQLVAKYPTKTIAVFTPLQRANGFVANGSGYKLVDVADAIINVCNHYGIPVLDLYCHNNLNVWDSVGNTTYFTPDGASIPAGSEGADGLHPNSKGHSVIADKILAFLNTL